MSFLCFRHRIMCAACVFILAACVYVIAGSATASAAPAQPVACDTAPAGDARCDSDLLVSKRTHLLVRPTVNKVAAKGKQRHAHRVNEPLAHSPQWLQQAYDLTSLSATKGAGDTVAVVDAYDDPAAASDLATFRSTYGLPACSEDTGCLKIVNESGQSAPLPAANAGWTTEETADLDAVSAICPNCNILVVEADSAGSGDLEQAMQAAANLGANQISDSWSIPASSSPFPAEPVTSTTGAAVPAIFAASGDTGSDAAGTANYPAALSTVTAVGGTTLWNTASATTPRGYSESAWSGAGAGCATDQPSLAYQTATGCSGRAYSDVSADADPNTGLSIYQASTGGWAIFGGTSLATPIVAAFDALTAVDGGSPEWAYSDAAALNDPTGGSDGSCAGLTASVCDAGKGYDAPTGAGSISGAVVTGAPTIGGATFTSGGFATDTAAVTTKSASLVQGAYSNGELSTYSWQYGTTAAYGKTTAVTVLAASTAAQSLTVKLSGLHAGTTYHYRLIVTNASGSVKGPDMTLTTAAASVA